MDYLYDITNEMIVSFAPDISTAKDRRNTGAYFTVPTLPGFDIRYGGKLIRCVRCKHFDPDISSCLRNLEQVTPADYCSRGEAIEQSDV